MVKAASWIRSAELLELPVVRGQAEANFNLRTVLTVLTTTMATTIIGKANSRRKSKITVKRMPRISLFWPSAGARYHRVRPVPSSSTAKDSMDRGKTVWPSWTRAVVVRRMLAMVLVDMRV